MSRRTAPAREWVPVFVLTVAAGLFSLWLERHEGPTLLSTTAGWTCIILFIWLFERL